MEDTTSTALVFPTEAIDLPSRGLFYPEFSPLRSGQIELKYMTAKEEDILTSTNLIQKGIVLDRLLDSLIVTKGVKSSDLLIGDLNAVMVASRILGYGKDYPVKLQCPTCNQVMEQVIDLTTLTTENEPVDDASSMLKITLPLSKAEVSLKLLTRNDELAIDKEIKALKKTNAEIEQDATTRLRAMIVSVNGDSSRSTVWKFVENLLVRDARFLREEYKKFIPDVNFEVTVDCSCGNSETTRLPIGPDFFWPNSRV
jgi:hypothetical protein